jgi:hypothetical protein
LDNILSKFALWPKSGSKGFKGNFSYPRMSRRRDIAQLRGWSESGLSCAVWERELPKNAKVPGADMKYTLYGWLILLGVLVGAGALLYSGHYILAAVVVALPGYVVKDLADRRRNRGGQ